MQQEIRRCKKCGCDTIHIKNSMNFWVHFVLVLLTGLLWLIPLVFYKAYCNLTGKNKWRCTKCLEGGEK